MGFLYVRLKAFTCGKKESFLLTFNLTKYEKKKSQMRLREALNNKNKHCEVLVSCSGQKIQKDSKRNKQEQTGTNRNLQEPSGTACKLL